MSTRATDVMNRIPGRGGNAVTDSELEITHIDPSLYNHDLAPVKYTAVIAFFVGALWVSVISQIGIAGFVNALGAIVAPFYGIIVVDFYLVKKRQLNIQQMFSSDPDGAYYYLKGWNQRALLAFGLAALFSISTVWVPALSDLGGYAWLIGAFLGGLFYYVLMNRQPTPAH